MICRPRPVIARARRYLGKASGVVRLGADPASRAPRAMAFVALWLRKRRTRLPGRPWRAHVACGGGVRLDGLDVTLRRDDDAPWTFAERAPRRRGEADRAPSVETGPRAPSSSGTPAR